MTPYAPITTVFDDERLMKDAFRERPVFKVPGPASHVRAWDKFTQHLTWVRYHNSPAFRAAYDARLAGTLIVDNAHGR